MKLHLPLKLRAALLALCLTSAPSAFSFQDTIFKFEGTTASETGTGLHMVADTTAVVSGTTQYIDSGLVVGYAIGDYKLTRDLGKAFSFNDATRISISDDYWKDGISPSSSFTLAAYVNFSSISGVNALFGTGANGNTGFSFSVVDGKLRVTTKLKADYTLTEMPAALKANTWYAVAVSYSYDTTEGKYYASFYVDGDPVGKVEVGTAFNTPGTDGGAAIGSNSSGADNDLLNGAIAEFQILSGAKSQEEIKSLFGLTTVNDLWWKGTATDTAWDTVSTRWASTQAATSANTVFTQGERVHFGTEGGAVTLDENIIVRGIEAEGNWKFTLGAGKTLNSPYVHSTGGVTFSGAGTVTLDGGNNAFTGSELLVSGGTVEFIYNNSNKSSCISSGSNVKVTGGGTLKLTGHDMLGWEGVSPDAINLEGTSVEGVNKIATLQINETDSTKAMTLSSAINMSGYSVMTGSAFNTFGTTFHVSGIGNIIFNEKILLRNALNIEVETGGELTISSRLTDHADNDKPKTITKTGEGKLIFSKLENASVSDWSKDLTVTGGTVQLNGVTLGTGTISLAKDTTLEVAGTVTQQTDDEGNVISGIAIVGEGKLVVLSGANLTLNRSVTLGATIENAGTLTLGTSGSLRFTSRDVLTQNTDVVYKDNLNSNNSGNGFSSGSYFIVQQTSAGAESNNISKVYFGNDT
ncbi:MAG: LamG domain-containing protein, partial [Akkermansia sp.]